jgi:ELWxxDGT repeat protein
MPRSVYGEGPAHDVVRFGDRIVFSTWPPPTTANSYFLSDAAFATTSNLVAGSSDHVLQSYGPDGAGGVLMSCRLAGPGSNSNLCAVRAGESQAALIAPNLLSYGQVFSIGSAGNVALFFLDDYTHVEQRGLWRSDGTAPGTFRVHPDLRRTGASGSGGVASYALPDRLLFDACNSPAAECGLYVTDGTQAGTHFVTALPARVDQFVALGERIALMVGEGDQQQLWISDGTAAGTDLLRSFAGRPVSSVASFGDRLHFIVGMPGPVNLSPEYYLSDGRKDGTHSVVLPAGLRPEILPIARLDADTAVFNCSTVATGSELCAIAKDGSGAHLIMDILPGPNSSGATLIGSTADAAYYAADDGYRGNELWQLRSRSDRLFRDGFQ